MEPKPEKRSTFRMRNIILALVIGLAVTSYLIKRSFDYEAFLQIEWTWRIFMFLGIGLLMMVIRHLGYMYRVYLVTGKVLSFKQAFQVIMMWEFASAATPSTVGGAAVAMFIINKEGVNLGKSTASVMVITFMDNLFFVLASSILFVLVGGASMFAINTSCEVALDLPFVEKIGGLPYVFLLGYGFSLSIAFGIAYGVFVNPKGMKQLLTGFFSLGFLRRWKEKAVETGNELIITSKEFRGRKLVFWLNVFLITTIAWSSKYMVVNVLLAAFGDISADEQVVIAARVLTLWVIMFLPFTPGASGVAELAFLLLMCTFVDIGLIATITLLWRMLTYYPYLIVGTFTMPAWLRRVGKRGMPSQ